MCKGGESFTRKTQRLAFAGAPRLVLFEAQPHFFEARYGDLPCLRLFDAFGQAGEFFFELLQPSAIGPEMLDEIALQRLTLGQIQAARRKDRSESARDLALHALVTLDRGTQAPHLIAQLALFPFEHWQFSGHGSAFF